MQNGSPRFVMIGAPANSSTSDPYAISRVLADHNKHAISHGDKLRDHLEAKRKEGSRVATAARVQRHNAEDYMKMVGSRLKELADSSKRFVKQLHTPGTAGDGAVMQAGSGWGGNGCDYGKLDDRRPQVVQTARCEVVNVADWVKNSPRYSATNYASTTTTATNRRNTKLLPSLNTSSNSISLSPNGHHGRSSSGGGRNASIMPPRRGTTLSARGGGGVATSGGGSSVGGLHSPSPQITTTAATVLPSSPSSSRVPNPPTSTSSTAANSPLTSQQKRQLSIAARTASLVADPATATPLVRVTTSGSISGEGGGGGGGGGSTLFEMPRLLVSSDGGGDGGGGTLDASALVSPPSPSGISAPFIVSSSSLSIKHHHSASAPTGQPATSTAGAIIGRRSTPSALTSHFVVAASPPSAVPSPEDSFNCSAHSVPPPNYYAPPLPQASSSTPASRRHSLDGINVSNNTSAANIEGWGGGSSSQTPSSQQLLHHPHPPPPSATLPLPVPPLLSPSSTTLQTTTSANNKPVGATPHRRAAASFALPHSSHPLGHTATTTTGGSNNDETSSSSSGSLHPLSRREVQQAELDFLMLSYGSTHIQLKHLKEWGPEQSCHAGKQRIKFFTLVGAAETLGVEELSFTDFLVTATGLSATQVRAAIGKYALQIGWAKDLGLIMANRVSRAYKLLTEEGAQLADFESYVKFHRSIKDDKIVSEASLFAIFTKADVDSDGLLSKKEYASLFANHPASTRVLLGGL